MAGLLSMQPHKQFSDERLSSYLEGELGFDLRGVDLTDITKNLRLSISENNTFAEYSSAVSSLIAVHETYFLRHHEQFDWLESIWLPRILSKLKGRKIIRILSAGCSTGEEAYSIKAQLQPLLDTSGVTLLIDAVDISQIALDKAEVGRYGLWSLRGVNTEQEVNWLDVTSRNVYVKPWVKKGIQFSRLNITQPFPQSMQGVYDLVLCRNVMIYMHAVAIEKVYANLQLAIRPCGLIMSGPSDPNPEITSTLQLIWENGVRLYAKNNALKKPIKAGILTQKAATISQKTFAKKDMELSQKKVRQTTEKTAYSYQDVRQLLVDCQYTLARKALETNLTKNPLDLRAYVMLAEMALDLDELALASHALRKALFLKPNSVYIVYLSANYKYKTGDHLGGEKALLWLKNQLLNQAESDAVEFCEDITLGELKGVVNGRFR